MGAKPTTEYHVDHVRLSEMAKRNNESTAGAKWTGRGGLSNDLSYATGGSK